MGQNSNQKQMVQIVIITLAALLISCSPKPEEFKPLEETSPPQGWTDYCARHSTDIHCSKSKDFNK